MYCEFFSQTEEESGKYITALFREAEMSAETWKDILFDTVYLGGGTPSRLQPTEISEIVKKMKSLFRFSEKPEITLECNPDDVTYKFALGVASAGINRVSIGMQSFDDSQLLFLTRRHTTKQNIEAAEHFHRAGIDNVSIDLIYGIPGLTHERWKEQLKTALSLHVKHISCYMLTVHENTRLASMYQKAMAEFPDDDDCLKQYLDAREILSGGGILAYEVSNFAVPGYESKHNMKYWTGQPWLGLGPSAHSFDGKKRWANPPDLELYYDKLDRFVSQRTKDYPDRKSQYNEYVMNRLRMEKGIDLNEFRELFPEYFDYFERQLKHLNSQWYCSAPPRFSLTPTGFFVSDYIIGEFFA